MLQRMKLPFLTMLLPGMAVMSLFGQEMDPQDMETWTKYMTPAEHHQALAEHAGDWKCHAKLWMEPAAPPQVSEGTAKIEMVLGGRYQKIIYDSTFMGMPLNGIGYVGYDNVKKKYSSIWMDNMGTSILVGEGTYNDTAKAIEIKGEMLDPFSGGMVKYRTLTKTIDKNKIIFEMYMVMEDAEFKSLELTYTR